jgi:hypothetical protein
MFFLGEVKKKIEGKFEWFAKLTQTSPAPPSIKSTMYVVSPIGLFFSGRRRSYLTPDQL